MGSGRGNDVVQGIEPFGGFPGIVVLGKQWREPGGQRAVWEFIWFCRVFHNFSVGCVKRTVSCGAFYAPYKNNRIYEIIINILFINNGFDYWCNE